MKTLADQNKSFAAKLFEKYLWHQDIDSRVKLLYLMKQVEESEASPVVKQFFKQYLIVNHFYNETHISCNTFLNEQFFIIKELGLTQKERNQFKKVVYEAAKIQAEQTARQRLSSGVDRENTAFTLEQMRKALHKKLEAASKTEVNSKSLERIINWAEKNNTIFYAQSIKQIAEKLMSQDKSFYSEKQKSLEKLKETFNEKWEPIETGQPIITYDQSTFEQAGEVLAEITLLAQEYENVRSLQTHEINQIINEIYSNKEVAIESIKNLESNFLRLDVMKNHQIKKLSHIVKENKFFEKQQAAAEHHENKSQGGISEKPIFGHSIIERIDQYAQAMQNYKLMKEEEPKHTIKQANLIETELPDSIMVQSQLMMLDAPQSVIEQAAFMEQTTQSISQSTLNVQRLEETFAYNVLNLSRSVLEQRDDRLRQMQIGQQLNTYWTIGRKGQAANSRYYSEQTVNTLEQLVQEIWHGNNLENFHLAINRQDSQDGYISRMAGAEKYRTSENTIVARIIKQAENIFKSVLENIDSPQNLIEPQKPVEDKKGIVSQKEALATRENGKAAQGLSWRIEQLDKKHGNSEESNIWSKVTNNVQNQIQEDTSLRMEQSFVLPILNLLENNNSIDEAQAGIIRTALQQSIQLDEEQRLVQRIEQLNRITAQMNFSKLVKNSDYHKLQHNVETNILKNMISPLQRQYLISLGTLYLKNHQRSVETKEILQTLSSTQPRENEAVHDQEKQDIVKLQSILERLDKIYQQSNSKGLNNKQPQAQQENINRVEVQSILEGLKAAQDHKIQPEIKATQLQSFLTGIELLQNKRELENLSIMQLQSIQNNLTGAQTKQRLEKLDIQRQISLKAINLVQPKEIYKGISIIQPINVYSKINRMQPENVYNEINTMQLQNVLIDQSSRQDQENINRVQPNGDKEESEHLTEEIQSHVQKLTSLDQKIVQKNKALTINNNVLPQRQIDTVYFVLHRSDSTITNINKPFKLTNTHRAVQIVDNNKAFKPFQGITLEENLSLEHIKDYQRIEHIEDTEMPRYYAPQERQQPVNEQMPKAAPEVDIEFKKVEKKVHHKVIDEVKTEEKHINNKMLTTQNDIRINEELKVMSPKTINVIADKVYKRLESRLRTEQFKHGI